MNPPSLEEISALRLCANALLRLTLAADDMLLIGGLAVKATERQCRELAEALRLAGLALTRLEDFDA
jgi:hypothetical protein